MVPKNPTHSKKVLVGSKKLNFYSEPIEVFFLFLFLKDNEKVVFCSSKLKVVYGASVRLCLEKSFKFKAHRLQPLLPMKNS
jgi:hypothetical protein